MLKKDWLALPENIQMFVAVDAEQLVYDISQKFSLTDEQAMFILDLNDEIFLKKIDPLSIPSKLDKMPDAKNVDVRLLALDIAYKILWPLQEHLETIDKLILRLGGKVPKFKTLQIAQDEKDSKLFPDQAEGTVKELVERYNDFSQLRLAGKKIIDSQGRLVGPTVENWIKDYVHFSGAGGHDSLKRAKYLSSSKNPSSLSDGEKESLRYFLVSYDSDQKMSFVKDGPILKVSEIKKSQVQDSKDLDFDQILEKVHQSISAIKEQIMPTEFVMSEAENSLNKVRDVLWDSIGLQDKVKVFSCLKVLIEKKSLDQMIREDNRFKGITKRFINIRYGKEMEQTVDQSLSKLILRRIFLENVLLNKLGLASEEATAAAYYLTNLLPDSGQVVYLDKETGDLKWREVQVVGSNFAWAQEAK